MKKGSTYKHTGIPTHWDIVRIKHLCDTSSGATPNSQNESYYGGEINWIQSGDLYEKSEIYSTSKTITAEALQECSALKMYKAPFIVMAMYGASVGNVAISNIDACTNQACRVLSPNNMHAKFLFYVLCNSKEELKRKALTGTQPNINQIIIRNHAIPLPPLDEQRDIAAFLDEKTEQLDDAIESVEKSVELLRELRAATISEAVTRGLNAHAPLRDSGVPWIGKVPVGWEVMRAKNCVKRRQNGNWGTDAGTSEIDKFCVRAADFDYKRLSFVPCEQMICRSYTAEQFEKVSLNPGDIVVEKSGGGEKVPVGRALLFRGDFEACYSNFLERLILNKEVVLPEFFIYWWSSNYQKGWFKPYFNQTTGIQNLNSHSLLSNTFISVPPLAEQQEIARYLDEKTAQIDALVSAKQHQVLLLRELRASVIAEAVTGKLGIRE